MATTEQLMTQYGVAWFEFDEASGNILDKLDNSYTGIVTGATRVQGWNGIGHAMSFPVQTNIVTFNHKIIPIGEKSIRFKIKTAQLDEGIVLLNTNGISTTYGIDARVSNGYLIFNIHDAKGWADTLLILRSKSVINDNKWHDILFTWDGTLNQNSAKIFVDDMNVYNNASTPKRKETTLATHNLSFNVTSTSHFYGQIDDLQIYSKALSPTDLTQKRLAVKSTDNKNLVLPYKQGRVREIPSMEEVDLLELGYVYREIDDAIDTIPIDFTIPATKYEKTSKTQSPLGTGKVFNVQVEDFKTIDIEDNY